MDTLVWVRRGSAGTVPGDEREADVTSAPRTEGRRRRLAANGITLAVTEYAGDGPPLLLLHGIGSRAESWWSVLDGLAAHFQLFALDFRGHGASAKPARGYLFPDYAADLADVLDALAIDRPRILGHSLGGLVALEWAKTHPCQAIAIALEDVALRSEPGVLGAFDGWLALASMTRAEAAAAYRQEYPAWSDEDCWRRAESITSTAPGVFIELRADSATNIATGRDRLGDLSGIHSPLLLVHGDRATGSMLVPDDAARLTALVPNARLARVPTAGHTIHRDHPAAFLAAVIPFLTTAGEGD
ncbi:MAG: alpha/beta hydrolase [Chloroflexia bacterium]|nr:alpha/beta hydrolase [Chloroflexia bacterium]